jgi:hypothetical protein
MSATLSQICGELICLADYKATFAAWEMETHAFVVPGFERGAAVVVRIRQSTAK